MTCIALRTGDCDDGVRQAIAIKIIELAKAAARNPAVLCDQALARPFAGRNKGPLQLAAPSVGRVSAASNAKLGLMGTQFSEVACLLLREWDPISPARPSFFCRRKSKDEKRLFFCEWRMRDPHAPRFSTPKALRGAIAQYLPSRDYRLVTGSLNVGEFHSYLVDVRAIIFDMEIVSGHDSAPPISAGGSTGLSLPPTPGGPCR